MALKLTTEQQAIVDAATPALLDQAAQSAFWSEFSTTNQEVLQNLLTSTIAAYLVQFPNTALNAKSLALQTVRQNINKILNATKLS